MTFPDILIIHKTKYHYLEEDHTVSYRKNYYDDN